MRYDNCYSCANSNCELAGKDRLEFIIAGEESCKDSYLTWDGQILKISPHAARS